MNDTEYLLTMIVSAAIGYTMAYCTKHIGYYWQQWGMVICYFAFPTIAFVLLLAAARISDHNEPVFSIAFLIAFILGMLKPRTYR